MKLTPEQVISVKEWNEILSTEVENALGSQLDGKFTAANYTAGFNYVVRPKNYNIDSLKALDTKVDVRYDVPCLQTGFSDSYNNVIGKIAFYISKEDRELIQKEEVEQATLVQTIINDYIACDMDETPMKDPTVQKIMKRIQDYTGVPYDKVSVMEYPYLSTLCNRISEYTRKAIFTAKIQMAAIKAERRLQAIMNHIEKPDEKNGGLKTDVGYVCGWDNIKESPQLLESLKGGNAISLAFMANDFYGKESHLNLKNKARVKVPVNWMFHLGANHSDEYDLSKFAQSGSELSATITYDGITVVPANPTKLSADNERGWYASDILEEAAAKSGKDITGYQLVDSQYDPKTVFGKNGTLRRMKTIIISQHPSIKLHFSKFNCAGFEKMFKEKTEVELSLFGDLISCTHENGYTVAERKYDASAQSLEVTLKPKSVFSSGSAASQTAYVLGGVAEYFDNEIEVNKVMPVIREDNDEPLNLPEEYNQLQIMYRKNKDGIFEYAGLYNENEDLEYQLGETEIVPFVSRYLGKETLSAGRIVWNVEDSSNDSCRDRDGDYWLDIWRNNAKGEKRCYVSDDAESYKNHRDLVGAHVVADPNLVKPDDQQKLYIIPICRAKNIFNKKQGMKITQQVEALVLDKFLK